MKKIFLTTVFIFACGFFSYAFYSKNYPITVTQPDGAVVHCFTSGDEFYRWVHDENGYTLIQDPQTGVIVYAMLENDELVSTGYRIGSVDPAIVGIEPWQIISAEKRMQLRSDFLKNIPEPPEKEGYRKPKSGWNNGTINNLVIYIRFSDDEEFAPKGNKYNEFFNTGQSSMYNYFEALSYGKTYVSSTFYPESVGNDIISYHDIYPRSFFTPYNATTNPDGYENDNEAHMRTHQLLVRTVNFVADEIPEDLDLDFNKDGRVDNICFIVKGNPGAWASLLWPHMSSLYSEEAYINGVRVWTYNFQIETHLDKYGSSVLSHEMFHTLGAPDLYRYYDKTIDPVGAWDVMCSDQKPPQSTTAWMKYKYGGWIDDIPEITENGTYTLHNIWSETNNAYKIPSPKSSTEFFIVEYRNKNVYWESEIPGSGLLIYRINTLVSNGNAGGPPDELYIFRPGGTTTTTPGSLHAAHFSANSGRTVFTNASNPPCFLSNNKPGGIAIINISESGGETMTFEVNDAMVFSEVFVSTDVLTFSNIPLETVSEPQTISVYGVNLIYPITYEKSDNNEVFTIDEIEWDPNTGGTLSVTFKSDIPKIYSGKIVFNSLGALSKSVTLKGESVAVGIDEQDAINDITIFPNPTDGEWKIECKGACSLVENVEIFDIMGQRVMFIAHPPLRGGLGGLLPVGVYFIRITTENNVITRKIIKN